MKYEEALFRIKPDHNDSYSFKLTRTELLRKLGDHLINRSHSWPYSLKIGKSIIVKNKAGKCIEVIREKSYYELHRNENTL